MKNILLINSAKVFAHSHGELNTTLHNFAVKTLTESGFQTKETIVDHPYEKQEEIDKIVWADAIIYQLPGWWMGMPWILKKYLDEVLTSSGGKLYGSDGRSATDPAKKYGSGGMLKNHRYMISSTWNAPVEAFNDPTQFFEGAGIDGVFLPLHKVNQFLGMQALPSFTCHDVTKNPQVSIYLADYQKHLVETFGKATSTRDAVL